MSCASPANALRDRAKYPTPKRGLLLRQSPPRSPSGPVSIGDPGADFVNDGINGASAAAGVAQRVRLSHFAIVKSSIEVRFSTRSHLLSNSKPRELHKAFLHRPPCYLKFEPRIYLASGLF